MSSPASLPSRNTTGYLPSLDGWRALAILAVLMNHDTLWQALGHSNASVRDFGGWGVYLFFAISGILICGRILDDEQKSGRIDLRAFYLRRIFRIQPAALCYLAAIAILTLLQVTQASWSAWLSALLLYTNYIWHVSDDSGRTAFIGHFWTLAVEEHFYIFLSLLLFVFRKRRILVFSLTLVALFAGQAYAFSHHDFSFDSSTRRTPWIIHFLLIPAFVALLLRAPRFRLLAVRYLHPGLVFLLTGIATVSHQVLRNGLAHWHTNFLNQQSKLILYSMTVWVVSTMLHRRSLTTRFLELPPLRFIGRLSYSLYLWHVLFFIPNHPEVGVTSPTLLFLAGRPWKYLATAACALLSYYLLEKPCIRLGHRLAPPATPGHRDLAVAPAAADPRTLPAAGPHPDGFAP